MKKWIAGLLLLAVMGAGFYGWQYRQEQTQAAQTKVETTLVERGPMRLFVSTTGRLIANLDVEIKSKASGEIINLAKDVSDPVKKGELLVELDPADEERQVKQAEVSLLASQSRLIQARQNLSLAERAVLIERQRSDSALKSAQSRAKEAQARASRLQALFARKLTTQEELDTAQTAAIQASAEAENTRLRLDDLQSQTQALELRRQDVKLAEAQVQLDQIALSNSQQRLRDTKVFSPIDGVVASRPVQIGQIVSSGISTVGGGTTMMVISDLSQLYVVANVDESDIGRVKLGQSAKITTDAFPNHSFEGKVVRIATRGVNSSNVVTFEVKLEVQGPSQEWLKPEMTANVEIVAAEKAETLKVRADVLTYQENQALVKVIKNLETGETEDREVEAGLNDGVMVELLQGVKEGEVLAIQKGGGKSRWKNSPLSPPRMARPGK